MLGTLVLALHDNTGRKMRDPDCRGCLVDMLSACTAGTIGIDTDIVIRDIDINVFLDVRHNLTGCKGCLALAGRIER